MPLFSHKIYVPTRMRNNNHVLSCRIECEEREKTVEIGTGVWNRKELARIRQKGHKIGSGLKMSMIIVMYPEVKSM